MEKNNKAAKDALKKKEAPARVIVTDEYGSPVEGEEFQGKLESATGAGLKQQPGRKNAATLAAQAFLRRKILL